MRLCPVAPFARQMIPEGTQRMLRCDSRTASAKERQLRAIFIRHGQSTVNAGLPCNDVALVELTHDGWEQARIVAAGFSEQPSLIVISPYLRTQQTARPTIERFPDVPVETWPIQELSYLARARWNGSPLAELQPHVERFWNRGDPGYSDGEGAETFSSLLRRCEATLQRLAALPEAALVYLFSHGHFIKAIRSIVSEPALGDRDRMQSCYEDGIANGELVELTWSGGWTMRAEAAD
jgi:broad specificity phosphatase PhoE